MPIEVTRIVTTVIEWPPRTRTLALSIAGAERARHRCGDWPTVATIDGYIAAVRRAGHEVEHCAALAQRYWSRFGRDITEDSKLRSRHEVARELFEQRSECLALLTGRPEGSA